MKQYIRISTQRLLRHFLYKILRPHIIRFVKHFISHHLIYLIAMIAVSTMFILLSPGTISLEDTYRADNSETPKKPYTLAISSSFDENKTGTAHDLMANKPLSFDTSNPYWDKISIKGSTAAEFDIKSKSSPYIIELPENFIEKTDNNQVQNILSDSIQGFNIKSIYDSQYIYLYCEKNYPLRIYTDSVNENILHIAVAKKENPYHSLVVIDPGHGGDDPGAINGDACEKDIVLDIALRMEHKLKDIGVNTIYTRNTDEKLYYRWITDYTNSLKPDAFVSIHINSYEEPEPNGIATYYYTSGDYQKNERIKLATLLQESLMKEFSDWTDMGIEKRDYWVVRKNDYPGALIEFGYISNPHDLANLLKPEIRERASSAIVNGVGSFFKQ